MVAVADNRVTLASFMLDIHKTTLKGMVAGGLLGTAAVSSVGGLRVMEGVVERIARAVGMEPSAPLYSEDCQLPQFRDFSACTVSMSLLASTVIPATIVSGYAIGFIYGVAKNVFGRPHSA